MQFSGLSPVVHFVPFGCSSQSFLLPFHSPVVSLRIRQSRKKRDSLPVRFLHLIFTRSLPCVRRGYCIRNTASFRYAPQAMLHYIPAVFCVCRPWLFQRLLFRPAIGVGSAPIFLRFTIHRNILPNI